MANPGHQYGHSMMSQPSMGQQYPANTMASQQQQQQQQQGMMASQHSMMGVQQTQQSMMVHQPQTSVPQQVVTTN